VPLEYEAVEARDGVVIVERILGAPLIGRLERLQHAFGEDDVRRGERPEKVLRDVPGHPVEAAGRVVGREHLMLVVVAVGEIDLADAPRRAVAEDLGEDADLEPPVGRHADLPREVRRERELSRERVAERGQEFQIGMRPEEGAEAPTGAATRKGARRGRSDGRCSGVIALAEVQVEDRVHDRVEQPRKRRALVVQHVSVMESDVLDVPRREEISERHPAGAPLPRSPSFRSVSSSLFSRAFTPGPSFQSTTVRRSRRLKYSSARLKPASSARFQRDEDRIEIRHLRDLVTDSGERRTVELRQQAWDEESGFVAARVPSIASSSSTSGRSPRRVSVVMEPDWKKSDMRWNEPIFVHGRLESTSEGCLALK